MKRNTIVEIISSLLVLLFVYAAVSKLLDYQTFKAQLTKSPFITQFAWIIAWALPVGELVVAGALLSNRMKLLGLFASLYMMTMFTAYLLLMLKYSYYIPCSCGGILSGMNWTTHLWFNVAFVIMSIAAILLFQKQAAEKPIQSMAGPIPLPA